MTEQKVYAPTPEPGPYPCSRRVFFCGSASSGFPPYPPCCAAEPVEVVVLPPTPDSEIFCPYRMFSEVCWPRSSETLGVSDVLAPPGREGDSFMSARVGRIGGEGSRAGDICMHRCETTWENRIHLLPNWPLSFSVGLVTVLIDSYLRTSVPDLPFMTTRPLST
jgi:hypothetical protein